MNTFKKLREDAGITQENMAGYLDITLEDLVKIEENQKPLDVSLAEKYSALFNTPLMEVFDGSEMVQPNFPLGTFNVLELKVVGRLNSLAQNLRFLEEFADKHKP